MLKKKKRLMVTWSRLSHSLFHETDVGRLLYVCDVTWPQPRDAHTCRQSTLHPLVHDSHTHTRTHTHKHTRTHSNAHIYIHLYTTNTNNTYKHTCMHNKCSAVSSNIKWVELIKQSTHGSRHIECVSNLEV